MLLTNSSFVDAAHAAPFAPGTASLPVKAMYMTSFGS